METLCCMTDYWLFDQLSPEEKVELEGLTRQRTYQEGEVLFHEGDQALAVFLITQGRVKLFKTTEEGKEVTLGLIGPHHLFGEEALLTSQVQPFSAQAEITTSICQCLKSDFEELLADSGEVSMKLLKAMAFKLNQMTEQAVSMAAQDVRQRVLFTLSRLARDYGETTENGLQLTFRLTHEELSSLVGASRVMVTNVIQDLRESGKLSINGDQRFVLTRPALQTAVVEPTFDGPIQPRNCRCYRAGLFS